VHVFDNTTKNKSQIEDYAILREFKDVFLDEIPEFTPKRDIDFTIGLVLGL